MSVRMVPAADASTLPACCVAPRWRNVTTACATHWQWKCMRCGMLHVGDLLRLVRVELPWPPRELADEAVPPA